MSRSKKQTSIIGVTKAETEKTDKRKANRTLRRKVKIEVNRHQDVTSELSEVSDVWSFNKDGKRFLNNPTNKDLRK